MTEEFIHVTILTLMLKNSSVVQYNLYQEANPQYLALRTVLLIFWFVSSTKRNMRNVFCVCTKCNISG